MDNIFSGSILEGRSVVGSYVSGNLQFLTAKSKAEYSALLSRPNNSSKLRGVAIANKTKVFMDTIMPDPVAIYLQGGGKFVTPKAQESELSDILDAEWPSAIRGYRTNIAKMFIATNGYITGSDGAHIANETWYGENPFIYKYRNISRTLRPNSGIVTNTYDEVMKADNSLCYTVSTHVSASSQFFIAFTSGINGTFGTIDAPQFTQTDIYDDWVLPSYDPFTHGMPITSYQLSGLSAFDFMASFFGIDVLNSTSFLVDNVLVDGDEAKAYRKQSRSGVTIRGWKYGIMNGTPFNPKTIWRYGRYGQYRDMLEQRLYSKTLDVVTNTIDSPINIRFISGSLAAFTASNPELNTLGCGFYDSESKSSLPFYDV